MNEVEAFGEICQKIMNLEPKMRSARVINDRGHLIAGGMKKGLRALEDARQDEMMFMELALRVRMRHEFDKELGPVRFSLSYREKVLIMSFPLAGGNVLLSSAELDIDFKQVPFKILDILSSLQEAGSKTF